MAVPKEEDLEPGKISEGRQLSIVNLLLCCVHNAMNLKEHTLSVMNVVTTGKKKL